MSGATNPALAQANHLAAQLAALTAAHLLPDAEGRPTADALPESVRLGIHWLIADLAGQVAELVGEAADQVESGVA